MGVPTTNLLNLRAKIKITPSKTFLDQPLGAVYYPINTAQPRHAFLETTAETVPTQNTLCNKHISNTLA
jgi:hypothetical protein